MSAEGKNAVAIILSLAASVCAIVYTAVYCYGMSDRFMVANGMEQKTVEILRYDGAKCNTIVWVRRPE